MGLTIFGGKGFVGSHYVDAYYDSAIGNIVSINARDDYEVHSKDVLYLISTVHSHSVPKDPQVYIDTNLTTLITVLENWRKREDSKDGVFNFISSWFVYGKVNNAKECDQCSPSGFYPITKRCAEQLLESYCKAYGLKYRILRLANVIGSGDKKVSPEKNALQHILNKIKNNEDVELHGGGRFFRDYMHVTDCVRAIELVIAKGQTNTIYNVGNGPTWSFRDIVLYIKNYVQSTSKITDTDTSVYDFQMNTEKLKALGYVPTLQGWKLYDYLARNG